MNLKIIAKVLTSKSVGTGPSSCEKEFTGPRSHKGWETLSRCLSQTNLRCANVSCYGRPATLIP